MTPSYNKKTRSSDAGQKEDKSNSLKGLHARKNGGGAAPGNKGELGTKQRLITQKDLANDEEVKRRTKLGEIMGRTTLRCREEKYPIFWGEEVRRGLDQPFPAEVA